MVPWILFASRCGTIFSFSVWKIRHVGSETGTMKKRKDGDKAPVEFKNNPFKSLKGFSPPRPTIENKIIPRPKQEETQEDERELFLQAVTGARKVDSREVDSPGKVGTQEQAPSPTLAAIPRDSELFLAAMQKIGTTIREVQREKESREPGRRSVSSRSRQLKRGKILVSRELDLHGFLKDEALQRLEQFISEAVTLGQQAVLVITGKGLNSPEGPVLQGTVAAWLKDEGKRMVLEFVPAPRYLGGSGAFVVFLKKQ
jgi:DNA-nicking Smr family endonuclease